ncbi:MAG: 30S ribosomal protein S18 [Elusimicrobia bacterium]|nr:30S ribosomal protein S18 [Elusimicrobiota bacterium]
MPEEKLKTPDAAAAPQAPRPAGEGPPRPGRGYQPRGREGGFRRGGRFGPGRDPRAKKACRLCIEKKQSVDYKDIAFIRNYTTERGKILSGRITGACAGHQRKIRLAIHRARAMALMPFAVR